MMMREIVSTSLIAATLAAACISDPLVGNGDAGPSSGSGGWGPYTLCLCEHETQAYLDLSFVELADTVTGTITTPDDRVILRLDGVHWAPSTVFPFPLTQGSTLSVYFGPPDRPDLPADFAPSGSRARMGRLFVAPFARDRLSALSPGERFFGVLSGESTYDIRLRVAALRPGGDPVCDPDGTGRVHQPEVQVSRAELITILQAHSSWQDAWVACTQKLEETGGPSVGPLDYYPGP